MSRSIINVFSILVVAVSATILLNHREASGAAFGQINLCGFIGCGGGPAACADISVRRPSSECEPDVMCCPFPYEEWEFHCWERNVE